MDCVQQMLLLLSGLALSLVEIVLIQANISVTILKVFKSRLKIVSNLIRKINLQGVAKIYQLSASRYMGIWEIDRN